MPSESSSPWEKPTLGADPSTTTPRPSSGEPAVPSIPGYKVLGMIGRGGMGVVYKAEQKRLERLVAIKTLRVDPGLDQAGREQVERFLQEARALAKLGGHENLVQVHDIVEDAEGDDHIIMEFVDGASLAQRMREGPPLSLSESLRATRDAARALQRAHDSGIVHRDIKPSNIMLTPSGVAKVMDFGVARVQGAAAVNTASGQMVGTPLYMSPEQIRGKGVDGRSDIYSLSVMLYHLVCGLPPFQDPNALSLMFQHVHDAPKPPSALAEGIDPRLEAIILKGMAKKPEDRFASAGEMAAELEALLTSTGTLASGRTPPELAASSPDAPTIRTDSLHPAIPSLKGDLLDEEEWPDAPTRPAAGSPFSSSISSALGETETVALPESSVPRPDAWDEAETKPLGPESPAFQTPAPSSTTPEILVSLAEGSQEASAQPVRPKLSFFAALKLGLLGWMLPTLLLGGFASHVWNMRPAPPVLQAFHEQVVEAFPEPIRRPVINLRAGLEARESRPKAEGWLFLQIVLTPAYWWMLRRLLFYRRQTSVLLQGLFIAALVYGAIMLVLYAATLLLLFDGLGHARVWNMAPLLVVLPWPWLFYRLAGRCPEGFLAQAILGPLAVALTPLAILELLAVGQVAGMEKTAVLLVVHAGLLTWARRKRLKAEG
jgi:serine/threonine protein kinase